MHPLAPALAAAALVSGCVGGAAEGRRLEPLPSAASATTPAEDVTAVPTGSAGAGTGSAAFTGPATPAGAVAAARGWFAVLTDAGASGDTGLLRAAADPGCTACASLADFVEAGHRDGTVLRGFAYRPRSATPGPVTGTRVTVDLVVDVTGGTRTTAAGASQRLVDRAGVRNRMTLERRGDRWVVVDVVQPR